MIDEYWTFTFYGYHSNDLSYGSGKPIVARCDDCCQYRIVKKRDYRVFCIHCTTKGHRSSNFGKPTSDETKHKISEKKRGTHHSDAAKKKMSIDRTGKGNHMYGRRGEDSPFFGRTHSEETKRKMSDTATGRVLSDEWRHNMALARTGKSLPPFTDEHKQKISASLQHVSYEEWNRFLLANPYCNKFNYECKEHNRDKYGRTCFVCGKNEEENGRRLSVHHIDRNKNQGCDGHKWKLIPLCNNCHAKAHSDPLKSRIEFIIRGI